MLCQPQSAARQLPQPVHWIFSARARTCSAIALGLMVVISNSLSAIGADEVPGHILPSDRASQDRRLGPLKDLDGYFPLVVPETRQSWQARRDAVRRRILVATGLWPMPPRPTIQATVHGKVDREDYTVERVYFESYPGFYVTGSLYRPKGVSGKCPVVLSPHGHFSNGRFYAHSDAELKRQLETGAEQFEVGGRYPLQARCVQLARMGCVVFHYDMVGYADSQQISQQVAHGHRDPRPELETPARWGYFTAQAELRMQNMMGLQTFNSIRALDWVTGLPDVDPTRIGVTGASGGGTQTMILCAIDDRPTVSFPAVMVSTAMQGGCTCENACGLRVGTGNIEFAGLFAPKPLGMTSADDWTKELETKGLPELQKLYQLLGAPDHVKAALLTQFPHNYNSPSRHAMYGWFAEHLGLSSADVRERDYAPLSREELTVYDEGHSRPAGGEAFETAFLRDQSEIWAQQWSELRPRDESSFKRFRETVGAAWDTLLSHGQPQPGNVTREKIAKIPREGYLEFHDLLSNSANGAELPTIFLLPDNWNKNVVLWISGQGKASLFGDGGALRDEVRRHLDDGSAVAAIDLLYQGELRADDEIPEQAPRVNNERDFAGYTFGYNPTVFAWRVQDVLTLVQFVTEYETPPESVHLVGMEGAGPIAAAARALTVDAISKATIDTAGFRFASIDSWRDMNFVPGAVKYGDVPALLALSAPAALEVQGEGRVLPELVQAAYQAAGAASRVSVVRAD